MRIIGGQWKGRRLDAPRQGVRPTQDRIRESIFNTLQSSPVGAKVLDLYSGSGALGLEALSRGAGFVRFIDRSRGVCRRLESLLREWGATAGSYAIQCADAAAAVRRPLPEAPYDLALADPPYADASALGRLLDALSNDSMLAAGGLLVYEQSESARPEERPGWTLLRQREMGGTRVLYYRRSETEPKEQMS